MLPAQQGLDTGACARREIEDRLVDQGELLVGQRLPQAALQRRVSVAGFQHPLAEEPHAGTARPFRFVHRDVRVADDRIGGRSRSLVSRYADARR